MVTPPESKNDLYFLHAANTGQLMDIRSQASHRMGHPAMGSMVVPLKVRVDKYDPRKITEKLSFKPDTSEMDREHVKYTRGCEEANNARRA